MTNEDGYDRSRRNFIKGLGLVGAMGAVTAGSTLVGCSPNEASSTSSPGAGDDAWDDSADLVVVGSGTGLGAALPALDAGKSVLVLEKYSMTGGDWGINGGVVYAACTKVQEENGVVDERTGKPDDLDVCYDDYMRACSYRPDPTAVRRIVDGGADMIDYFTSLGIEFDIYQSGPDPVKRGHTCGSGGAITQAVVEDISARGGRVLTNMRVDHILLDDQRRVSGVEVWDAKNGKALRIAAKAVLVATGGAGKNEEMVARYNPESALYNCTSGPWATGDGITLLQEVRGSFCGYEPITLSYLAHLGPNGQSTQFDTTPLYSKAGPMSYIYVNKQGKRQYDEQAGGEGSAYLSYPVDKDIPEYGVFDQAQWEDPGFTCFLSNSHDALDSLIESGDIKKGDTLEDLAAELGIDPDGLAATVQSYNAGIDAGADEFGRNIELSRKLEKAPYYGFETRPSGKSVNLSAGVDDDFNVLDLDGNVIRGLYAGGNKMINDKVLGFGYPGSGVYVASGFISSKYAGECAVKYMS